MGVGGFDGTEFVPPPNQNFVAAPLIVQAAPVKKISFRVEWAPTGVLNPDDWGGNLDDGWHLPPQLTC